MTPLTNYGYLLLMTRSAAALALAAIVVSGCASEPTAPAVAAPLGLEVAVAKTAYSFASDTAVRVTFENTSAQPVYLLMGTYVVCERLVGESWQYESEWFVVDGIGPSFPLAPGASIADEMRLAYLTGPGTFRFLYRVWADPALRTVLHIDDRVSPTFTVDP